MDDASQRVYCLLKREFEAPPTMANLSDELRIRIASALKPAIDDGTITLDAVDVDSDVTKALAVVWWTNRRTSVTQMTNVPLRQ
jgi:hypothetical protein